MRLLHFALVGCGRIFKRHSDLPGHDQIHNASLVAVCDLVRDKAEKVATEFSVPYFTDMHAMIRACDESGAKLFVVKQNRFNVPLVKLREALEAGRFGKTVE